MDLRDEITASIITVRNIEKESAGRVVISCPSINLYDRVVGLTVCAKPAHGDNLLVSKWTETNSISSFAPNRSL